MQRVGNWILQIKDELNEVVQTSSPASAVPAPGAAGNVGVTLSLADFVSGANMDALLPASPVVPATPAPLSRLASADRGKPNPFVDGGSGSLGKQPLSRLMEGKFVFLKPKMSIVAAFHRHVLGEVLLNDVLNLTARYVDKTSFSFRLSTLSGGTE